MKKLRTKLSYALYTFLVCLIIGCEKEVKSADCITEQLDENVHHVSISTLQKNGMKYIIASARYGGVDISNVTLDSLLVEYYKGELNN